MLGNLQLQAFGHVNHNQSSSGMVESGKAGNPSIAPSVHAHPAKVGAPAVHQDVLSVKSNGRSSSADHAVSQVTTPRWSHR
jgi:uncharacterized protein YycO